jgi:hypothetical protein
VVSTQRTTRYFGIVFFFFFFSDQPKLFRREKNMVAITQTYAGSYICYNILEERCSIRIFTT